MSAVRPLIRSVINLVEKRAIRVEFSNGAKGLYPYVWLRDCSLEPHTYTISAAMKGRLHFMRDFDVRVRPEEVGLDEKGQSLVVKWPGGLLSRYAENWLRSRCPADDRVCQARKQLYLGRECVRTWDRKSIGQRMRRFAHGEMMADDKVLHDFLWAVCEDGIAVLEGADPADGDQALRQVADRIGFLQRTHFGEVFEVCPKPTASNMAYAGAQELPLHTDFPSLESPPSLQLLHVRRRAECGGGLSLFVDGFHVGEQMASEHPEQMGLLCQTPVEFVEEGFDRHWLENGREECFRYAMAARHSTFRLDALGRRVVHVQFGNVMRSWFLDLADPMLIQRFYDALKQFTELCYREDNLLELALKDGDTVLWANTRLLHGRTAYRVLGNEARERRLIGCYFGWDVLKSRVRQLRNSLGLPASQPML